jgi:hypothetical protein
MTTITRLPDDSIISTRTGSNRQTISTRTYSNGEQVIATQYPNRTTSRRVIVPVNITTIFLRCIGKFIEKIKALVCSPGEKQLSIAKSVGILFSGGGLIAAGFFTAGLVFFAIAGVVVGLTLIHIINEILNANSQRAPVI